MKQSEPGLSDLWPVGEALPGWTPRPRPPETVMAGRLVRIERLDPARHGGDLFDAWSLDGDGRMWTYLGVGPFADQAACQAWLERIAPEPDPMFHAFIDLASGRAVGIGSYMRIDPPNGVIEVGWLTYSPLMQRTAVSTEVMYLMMARAFDELGYRRYEWKCNALNAPSRHAALRLGFTFEGVFRQHMIVKGRNRDTAWYSMLDTEWPKRKETFERWLDPSNFDAEGKQRVSLSALNGAG